ncbi:unnamed protein product [Amoebophrya sp. A25]|nr:unnamed protein product [Amoebophrya sp. A25]|eukprot:GSA25T00010863001.1
MRRVLWLVWAGGSYASRGRELGDDSDSSSSSVEVADAPRPVALTSLKFNYGTLTPEWDPAVTDFTLSIPKCDYTKEKYFPLKATMDAGENGDIAFTFGDISDQSGAHMHAVFGVIEGITEGFESRDLTISVTSALDSSVGSSDYTIHVVADAAEQDPDHEACLLTEIPITCDVAHAKLEHDICKCEAGWMGSLSFTNATKEWHGNCMREPPRGAWPCQGTFPFTCGRCPSAEEASELLDDVTASCNIMQEDVSRIIWHTPKSGFETVHPLLKEAICVSPICRWRVELAANSFATCQAMIDDKDVLVHWRDADWSLITVKRFLDVFHSAKDACHLVRAATNVYSSVQISQKLLVTGVDLRSDVTIREAENAFRQAFSKVLSHPFRRLDVAIEPETCIKDPVCDHNQCGYGECVPWTAREPSQMTLFDGSYSSRHPNRLGDYGYRCLCNECFVEKIQDDGIRTCVRDETCKPKNYCEPNPCKCGAECIQTPERVALGEPGYQCKCTGYFTGDLCDTLDCPSGYTKDATTISADVCSETCVPMEGSNPCDPNPCQHGGACTTEGDDSFTCDCPTSFEGKRCEKLTCPDGFKEAGDICLPEGTDLPPPPKADCSTCDENPCANEGYCQVIDEQCNTQCTCVAGWTGDYCDTAEDVCATSDCGPLETCTPDATTDLGYTCESRRRALRKLKFAKVFFDKSKRRLDDGPGNLQSVWETGNALPTVMPLLPNQPVMPDEKANRCTVWQRSNGQRAQVTLSVKCPVDDTACGEMLSVLDTKHRYNDWADLEAWTRVNCIGTHVNTTSEPTEERMLSNCPAETQMASAWNFLHEKCHFQDIGLGKWRETGRDEMEVVITDAGVESVEETFRPLVCGPGMGICRAAILKYADLFKTCRNSAPGEVGKLARRAKALKNFGLACANPRGKAVVRMQVKVNGLLDELSAVELSVAEKFVQKKIEDEILSSSLYEDEYAGKVAVLARPALDRINAINSRLTVPLAEFAPTLLPTSRNDQIVHPCTSPLCAVAVQPGPTDAASDPAAQLFVTFNNAIKPGPCFSGTYDLFGVAPCEVRLMPAFASAKNSFVLSAIDKELIFAGETLQLRPKTQLAPFSNYTVTITPGLVTSARDEPIDTEIKYWFLTGAPRGSTVKLSIAVGCDDEYTCNYMSDDMKQYSSTPVTTLIEPLTKHINEFRATVTPGALQAVESQMDAHRRNALLVAQGLPPLPQDDAVVQTASGGGEAPLVETTASSSTTGGLFDGSLMSIAGSPPKAPAAKKKDAKKAAPESSNPFAGWFGLRRLATSVYEQFAPSDDGNTQHKQARASDMEPGLNPKYFEQDLQKARIADSVRRLEKRIGTSTGSHQEKKSRRMTEDKIHANLDKHLAQSVVAWQRRLESRRLVVAGSSGGTEAPGATAGDPVVEIRGEKKAVWVPPNTWLTYARMVPFVCLMVIVAMLYNGSAVQYWVHDACIANGGYMQSMASSSVPQEFAKQEYVSFLTVDTNSLSRVLPPKLLWPLVTALTVTGSGAIGYFLCSVTGGTTSGLIGGGMTALASSCLWASYSLAVATWVAPSHIPFFLFHYRKKWGLWVPMFGGYLRPRTSKTVWTPAGPFNTQSALAGAEKAALAQLGAPSSPTSGGATGTAMGTGMGAPSSPLLAGDSHMADSRARDRQLIEHQKHEHEMGSVQHNPREGQHVEWHRQAEVTMYDDGEHTVVRIPKAPGSAKVQPTRLQEPFAPATANAETAWLLSALCMLFSVVLIPLNGLHLNEGQCFTILLAIGLSVLLSFFAKALMESMLKSHCKRFSSSGHEMQTTQGGKKYQVLATGMQHSPMKGNAIAPL